MSIQRSTTKEIDLYEEALKGNKKALTQLGAIALKKGQKGFSKLFFNFAADSFYEKGKIFLNF